VKSEIANQPSSGGGFQPVWQKKIGFERLLEPAAQEDGDDGTGSLATRPPSMQRPAGMASIPTSSTR